MADLYPAPFPVLIRRAFRELEREQKIFNLPASKFFHGNPDLDTSVVFHGHRASTPVGPAAGPQDQLVQNIILSWLGGGRIVELKTVQINDELKIPRPCIDAANVGYNVEWSQELRLEQSLHEYVAASMLLEMIQNSNLLGRESDRVKQDTILDMSVGYDLEGIRSDRVRKWIDSMKDATVLVERLRQEIPAEFGPFRDLPYRTQISDSITLSTFHGCPADEIERIVDFLLRVMDVHVTIKMNPTLLGREAVEYLLHDQLGYRDIRVTQEAFDKDLKFEEALEICRRLDSTARRRGKKLAVKFSNTLVVVNHKSFFDDRVMYMSGAPLHVITMNLVDTFRRRMGDEIPISFSAGIDQFNFPTVVGLNCVPVTTCTDLLRPGGYGRLHKYLTRLESRMTEMGVSTIDDYILKMEGIGENAIRFGMQPLFRSAQDAAADLPPEDFQRLWKFLEKMSADLLDNLTGNEVGMGRCIRGSLAAFESSITPTLPDRFGALLMGLMQSAGQRMVNRAGLLNTPLAVDRTTEDPRYGAARNQAMPKKIGSQLMLYDCINCDKCVPVCPNDANFVYTIEATELNLPVYEVGANQVRQIGAERLCIEKSHQLANFADFCNECGNCDVFCPEDGGPYIEKPRFFGSEEAWQRYPGHDGLYIETREMGHRILGRFAKREFALEVDLQQDSWEFTGNHIRCSFSGDDLEPKDIQLLVPEAGTFTTDLRSYWIMKILYRGIMNSSRINYLNTLEP